MAADGQAHNAQACRRHDDLLMEASELYAQVIRDAAQRVCEKIDRGEPLLCRDVVILEARGRLSIGGRTAAVPEGMAERAKSEMKRVWKRRQPSEIVLVRIPDDWSSDGTV